MEQLINMSIECDVTNCRYNHEVEHYCTLNCIKVVMHQGQGSDCGSFKKK